MKDYVLVLGAPRSGTSFTCNLLEKMGMKFNIPNKVSLNNLIKSNFNFYQRRDIYLFLLRLTNNIQDNKIINENIDKFNWNIDCDIIKDPYLICILHNLKKIINVKKVILLIRNPNDVIESSQKFLDSFNSDKKMKYNEWDNYYITFNDNIGDIPYIIINYSDLICNTKECIDKMYNFLSNDYDIIKNIEYEVYSNTQKCGLYLPPGTKYLYKTFSEERVHSENIKDKYGLIKKIKQNDKCFCNSGKKYKKCCGL
jgi:hypothetical protein